MTDSEKNGAVSFRLWGMLFFCILLFCAAGSGAADAPPANNADHSKVIEGQMKNLEASYKNALADLKNRFDVQQGHMKNLEESYKNALMDLNSKFEAQKKESELKIRQIENEYQRKYWLLGTFGFVALLGMIIACYKKLFSIAEEKAREKFETLLKEEKDRMFQMIRLRDDEIKIKKEKSLVVLSAPDGDEYFLKNFFTKMKFEDVKYQNFGSDYNYEGEDLVLFNNEDGKLKIDSINKFVAEGPDTVFYFYFGGGRVDFPPFKHYSFANVRGQLYGNLMNALLQHDLLK